MVWSFRQGGEIRRAQTVADGAGKFPPSCKRPEHFWAFHFQHFWSVGISLMWLVSYWEVLKPSEEVRIVNLIDFTEFYRFFSTLLAVFWASLTYIYTLLSLRIIRSKFYKVFHFVSPMDGWVNGYMPKLFMRTHSMRCSQRWHCLWNWVSSLQRWLNKLITNDSLVSVSGNICSQSVLVFLSLFHPARQPFIDLKKLMSITNWKSRHESIPCGFYCQAQTVQYYPTVTLGCSFLYSVQVAYRPLWYKIIMQQG